MRVLFLNAYFEPEVAASLYLCSNLCEDLVARGHEVELHTPIPTRGVSEEVRRSYSRRRTQRLLAGNLTVHRFYLPREPRNTLLRALRYLWLELVLLGIGVRSRYDVLFLYSTPPTQGVLGAILRRMKGRPVIYNVQDIFPDSLAQTDLAAPNSPFYRLGSVLASFCYRHVDELVVISEDFRANLLAKRVPPEKITVVRNWVDEAEVHPVDRAENALFDRYGLDRDAFYISYCGNIGLTQNFELLVEVAKDLADHPSIQFLIIGDGAYRPELLRRVRGAGLTNITVIPFQPYEDIALVFSAGDVGLVVSKPNVGQNSLPSKTWSIMCAARPVLASFDRDSELSRLIEEEHCGLAVAADDRAGLAEAILRLYRDLDAAREFGHRGRGYIMANLTRQVGTGRIIERAEALVEAEPGRVQ